MADFRLVTASAVVVEDQVAFTLDTLCRASGARQGLVQALVAEGLLQPAGQGPQDWQFGGEALALTRLARRLARDFALDDAALGLVMDLLAENHRLRSAQRRA